MTRYTTIRLSEIAGWVGDYVDEADALRPGDEPTVVIVEVAGGRVLDIVDGYHRTAGYVVWAREEGLDLDEVEVRVVASDDGDLLAAAAEPGWRQAEALEAIYAAASAA